MSTIHGYANHRLYRTWCGMMSRCYYTSDPKTAKDYKNRGIRVCPEWHDPSKFIEDVLILIGDKPTPAHSLDRYPNNDGDYEPGNIRWATPSEQARNTRRNRYLTAFGEKLLLCQWAEKLGCRPIQITDLLDQGHSMEWVVLHFEGSQVHEIVRTYSFDDLPDFDDWEIGMFLNQRSDKEERCQPN